MTAPGERGDRDPEKDRGPTQGLLEPNRVLEGDDSGERAYERLEVDERARELRRHAHLRPREQPERGQRAGQPERRHGGERAGSGRRRRRSLGDRGHRQRGQRRGAELHGRDRARVAAHEQPRLEHDQAGRARDRSEHEQVAGERGAGAAAACHQGDAGDGDERAGPARGPGGPAPGGRCDHDDEHRHRADDQRGVAHARALDARVLEQDHGAVAESARRGDAGPERGAQVAPGDQREQRRGEREAHHGEPARAEPLQAQLGQRHGEAPERAGRDERNDRAATIVQGRPGHGHIVGRMVETSSRI